jgi:hypothetical protein
MNTVNIWGSVARVIKWRRSGRACSIHGGWNETYSTEFNSVYELVVMHYLGDMEVDDIKLNLDLKNREKGRGMDWAGSGSIKWAEFLYHVSSCYVLEENYAMWKLEVWFSDKVRTIEHTDLVYLCIKQWKPCKPIRLWIPGNLCCNLLTKDSLRDSF